MEKVQGSGSLWNVNSWHWEQKNYTPLAKDLIKEQVQKIEIQEDEIKITTSRLKNVTGEAEVNIRKGKTILVYDFSLEVEWEAQRGSDEASGTYKVNEIAPDDLDDIQIDQIKSNTKSDFSKKAEQLIKKRMKEEYKKLFKEFPKYLAEKESDPQKLEQDKLKREEAKQAVQQAKLQNGELKEQIFKEQQLKEQQMKQEFSQWSNKNQQQKEDN